MSLKPNTKTEVRRSNYKATVDPEKGRRRRENDMVEIRKNKREESLMKKRRKALHDISSLVGQKLEISPDMVAGVWSDDPALQLESTTQFRNLLSIEKPPIDKVIDSGVVPRLVEFLTKKDYPKIQFKAAWALTDIASGTSDHTKALIDHNAVPIFVHLLVSPNDDVREQSVWALGNIAGDSSQCCEYVLRCGVLVPLLNQLNEHTKISMLRVVTWTLLNLCRGGQVKPAPLQALERLIHSSDEQVLEDACWALKYLSEGTNEKIQTVIDAGVVPRLLELLLHPSPSVLIPVLGCVENLVTGDDLQTQCVINYGALPCLPNLLTQNYTKRIKKKACWMISNITAGTKEQIQMVLEANLIAPLVNLLQNGEFDIKKEAACAISNITSCGTHDQIKYLVEQGCMKPLCDLLVCPEPKTIIICLEALENILKMGEAEMNCYAQLIYDAEGLEKIEELQSYNNYEIYEMAVKLLETYWIEDDEIQQPLGMNQVSVPSMGFNFSKRNGIGSLQSLVSLP